METKNQCAVEGCSRPRRSRKWCQSHYNSWYKHGDPLFVGRIGREPRHGFARKGKTPEWYAWRGMRQRCSLLSRSDFHNYGGRGITVCERWGKFENFIEDMGRKPSPQHSLERRDNNGPYSPENCLWALPVAQANNRRTNRILELAGERLTVAQWARRTGLRHDTISRRLESGWAVEKALTAPLRGTD